MRPRTDDRHLNPTRGGVLSAWKAGRRVEQNREDRGDTDPRPEGVLGKNVNPAADLVEMLLGRRGRLGLTAEPGRDQARDERDESEHDDRDEAQAVGEHALWTG